LANGIGDSATSASISAAGGVLPGDTPSYQLWYRDPAASACGALFNLSQGLQVVWN
jgi:hypothetical protein